MPHKKGHTKEDEEEERRKRRNKGEFTPPETFSPEGRAAIKARTPEQSAAFKVEVEKQVARDKRPRSLETGELLDFPGVIGRRQRGAQSQLEFFQSQLAEGKFDNPVEETELKNAIKRAKENVELRAIETPESLATSLGTEFKQPGEGVAPEEPELGKELQKGFFSPVESSINVIKEAIDIGIIENPEEKARADAALAQLVGIVGSVGLTAATFGVAAPITQQLLKSGFKQVGKKVVKQQVSKQSAKQLLKGKTTEIFGFAVPTNIIRLVVGGAAYEGLISLRVANLETSIVNLRETAGFVAQSVIVGELTPEEGLELLDDMEDYIADAERAIVTTRIFSFKAKIDKKNKEVETRIQKARVDLALRRRTIINFVRQPVEQRVRR